MKNNVLAGGVGVFPRLTDVIEKQFYHTSLLYIFSPQQIMTRYKLLKSFNQSKNSRYTA